MEGRVKWQQRRKHFGIHKNHIFISSDMCLHSVGQSKHPTQILIIKLGINAYHKYTGGDGDENRQMGGEGWPVSHSVSLSKTMAQHWFTTQITLGMETPLWSHFTLHHFILLSHNLSQPELQRLTIQWGQNVSNTILLRKDDTVLCTLGLVQRAFELTLAHKSTKTWVKSRSFVYLLLVGAKTLI